MNNNFVLFLSISEEEIDGLSLLYLSSLSMENRYWLIQMIILLKKLTVGIKTTFEKKTGEIERKCFFT